MLGKRIVVIPDAQVKEGDPIEHLTYAGRFVADKQPEYVVCIGDFWDFPSLSVYDKGKKSFEGRRLLADLEVGRKGMEAFLEPIRALQEKQRKAKVKIYNPRMVFTLGNHEERLGRIANDNPEFEGIFGYENLQLEENGWEVHDFLKPVEIEGIYFVHYLANPFSSRPYSGTASNILKTVGRSFVQGHKQTLDVAIRPTLDGKQQLGIVAGAFYKHDEHYKGYQGNNHFRGLVLLNNVKDGYGDPCFVSIDYLENRYGR